MVLEVVGPAGAGKTSFLMELARRSDRVHPIFGFMRVRYAADFALEGLCLLPRALSWYGPGRLSNWMEARRLLRLLASRRVVGRAAARHPIVALDQGPVYTLATLPDYLSRRNDGFAGWWEGVLRGWATTLDVVITLDAPDDILIGRIRGRDKGHAVKRRPDAEAREFLSRFRREFERTLGQLSAFGLPRILSYEAGRPVDALVEEALGALLPLIEPGRGAA